MCPRLRVSPTFPADRYSAIERENRILLEKMSHILHGNHSLDNRRKSKPRSMNRLVRRAELMRITEENQRILRKIQSSEPTYNHLAWEQERRQAEKYIESLSEYDKRGHNKALQAARAKDRAERGMRPGSAGRARGGRGRPASAPVRRTAGYGTGAGAGGYDTYGDYDDGGAGRREYRGGASGGGRSRPQSAGPAHHTGGYPPRPGSRAAAARDFERVDLVGADGDDGDGKHEETWGAADELTTDASGAGYGSRASDGSDRR